MYTQTIDHKKKRLCLCLCLCSDATEGGTREIGLIEYPPAVKANRVESRYPVQTTDIMATMLDILGLESFEGRPLDGTANCIIIDLFLHLNRDWSPRFSTLRDVKNGWVRAKTA